MSQALPRLRMNLDFMPSPVPDRPGLLIRDPYHYSDATLLFPPELVPALELFNGSSTELDLRQFLVDLTGQLEVSEIEHHLVGTLDGAGFLETQTYLAMRDGRHRDFAEATVRPAAHAGTAYPESADDMRQMFDANLTGSEVTALDGLCAIAAPHASPEGGWESYRDAYASLPASYAERVFVILGTSHYGQPNRFGLTRKDFETPLGVTRTEKAMVDWLHSQAPEAVEMEDYCHATEHSIEFQVAFLQHRFGPSIRTLPILAGPFFSTSGDAPESEAGVARFLGALGEFHARHKKEIVWVLGVDMAHVGARYGDPFAAQAHQGELLSVSARDKERIEQLSCGDAPAFWDLVREGGNDDLKWCGAAPFYTFLRAAPEARGRMLRYQHWQIDPRSVVSFAAMAFAE